MNETGRMPSGPAGVPVLVVTGSVGAGKSTIGRLAAHLLREADVAHALVDLSSIASAWPRPPDDPWNEAVAHRNLAALWANFYEAGARRLILCRVVQNRDPLDRVRQAVPNADIVVVRLRAALETVQARIRAREPEPRWALDAATHMVPAMEQTEVADHIVDNDDRSAVEVAREVLGCVGWLDRSACAP